MAGPRRRSPLLRPSHRPIDQIARADVRDWALVLLERPARRGRRTREVHELGHSIARGTVSRILTLLRSCFRDAIEDGLVGSNPAAGIRLLADARTDEPWTYLTAEEIDALLGCDAIPLRFRLVAASQRTPGALVVRAARRGGAEVVRGGG